MSLKKSKKTLAMALAASLVSASIVPAAVLANPTIPIHSATVDRLGGVDRYDTAVKISKRGWNAADTVMLASANDANLVDALTVVPLAKAKSAPILLTGSTELNAGTKAEINRLGAKVVYVASGEGVIPDSILEDLRDSGITIVRLGAADRYKTSVRIAEELKKTTEIKGVVIANAYANVDALSAAPIAGAEGTPILLTDMNTVPAEVNEFIKTNDVATSTVIGGTGVISDAVKNSLPSAQRLGGADRFETNKAVLSFHQKSINADSIYIANGNNRHLVDSLVGAALAAEEGSAIVFADLKELPAGTVAYLNENQAVQRAVILGGSGAVEDSVVKGLASAAVIGQGTTSQQTIQENAVITGTDITIENVTFNKNLVVKGSGVTLKNVTVSGQIYLDPSGVSGKLLVLNGVTAKGVVIQSASDEVKLLNTTADILHIESRNVDLTLDGTTTIKTLVASKAANVVVAPAAIVEKMTHVSGVTLSGGGKVNGTTIPVGGGSSGGGGTSPQTTVSVSTAAELTAALANSNVQIINLTADITASPTVARSVNLNFGSYTLTGNLTFAHSGTGVTVLNGDPGNRIQGELTVNTPNASFTNGVKASGSVNIINVEPGTWTETAIGNTLTITDSDGSSITVVGQPGSITVRESATGGLTLRVTPGGSVNSIFSAAPVEILVYPGAAVETITAAPGASGTTIVNNGTTGTVTANVPVAITVATGAIVTNINLGPTATGASIVNNGTTGTLVTQAQATITNAAGARLTNFTAATGAAGTSFSNSGTTGTVAVEAPIQVATTVPMAIIAENQNLVTTAPGTTPNVTITVQDIPDQPASPTTLSVSGVNALFYSNETVNGSSNGSNSYLVNLSSYANNKKLYKLKVIGEGASSTLVLTSITANGVNWISSNISTTLDGNGEVAIGSILNGLDPGNDGIPLDSFRTLFGSGDVVFNGYLTRAGINNSATIKVTLTLGNVEVPSNVIENNYVKIENLATPKTANVTVKSPNTTMAQLTSANFDLVKAIILMIANGADSAAESNLITNISNQAGNTYFNSIKLSQLVGKTITFGTAGNTYTINFVAAP